jgi:hypothetical protein
MDGLKRKKVSPPHPCLTLLRKFGHCYVGHCSNIRASHRDVIATALRLLPMNA